MQGERLLSTAETQALLVDMLQHFADYCQKHGLRYYLVGGTLLGAIRHNGFIPWDDDIDVGMPRPDYERFLELVQTEPVNKAYKVISLKDGSSPLPFAEMIHTGTRVERPTLKYLENDLVVQHAFLDIFPQDGWPESEAEAQKVVKKAAFLRFMNKMAKAKIGGGKTILRTIGKIPFALVAKMIGAHTINRKLDEFAKRYDYDSGKYVGAITYGIYGLGERCLRKEVVAFAEVEFEGRKFYAPGCWDSYLKGIFGDYMTLPPEEKRISHDLKVWLLSTDVKQ